MTVSAISEPETHIARGRPQDEGKYAAIIAAARQEFFDSGFSAASIEGIAKRAGVSKVTIYNRFTDKAGLFSTVISAECDGMRSLLCPSMGSGANLRDQLISFGFGMVQFLARDDITRFETMMAMEKERDPAIGELFMAAGPRRMQAGLIALLAAANSDALYHIPSPDMAAEMLAGMMKGFADMERRFSTAPALDAATIMQRVTYAVDTFLVAHKRKDIAKISRLFP